MTHIEALTPDEFAARFAPATPTRHFEIASAPALVLNQSSIANANNASMFDAGNHLAHEAEAIYRDGLSRMFADLDAPNEQQAAIIERRAADWKALCEKAYNDIIHRRSQWMPWTVCGPARYNAAKESRKADAEMRASGEWHDKREAFIANTASMLRNAKPLAEIIAEYRTGKRADDIPGDDPAAVEKLTARIEYIREQHERGKAMNKHWRKYATMKGFPGLTDEAAAKMDEEINSIREEYWRLPYARMTANVTANIRRLEQRRDSILKQREAGDAEQTFKGFTVKQSGADGRLYILFDDKPEADARDILKRNGFRWSPRNKVWQRQLTDNAKYTLKQYVIPELTKLDAYSE